MKRLPLNRDLSTSVGPDDFPLDWHNVITAKGLCRNEKLKLYVVRLSIAGKQFFLGNAYSQAVGARLYDLALWKFAGKLSRGHTPNVPEDFNNITQANVDDEAPRFNSIYAKLPCLCAADELLSEDELRASRVLSGRLVISSRTPPDGDFYLVALGRLKRLRLKLTEDFEHVSEWHSKLNLLKLPALYADFAALEQALAQAAKLTVQLETSMESNHDYYRKVNHGTEI